MSHHHRTSTATATALAGDTFDADRLRAEGARQAAMATAKTNFRNQDCDETTHAAASAQLVIDVQAADATYFRSCRASARANGRDEAPWISALRNLGLSE